MAKVTTMFVSDNQSGVAPEVVEALAAAAQKSHGSYGGDDLTAELTARFRDIFETDLAVFTVPTGTAANALALSAVAPSYGAVLCTADAHVMADECGAIENATGGARLEVPEAGPKLTAVVIDRHLSLPRDVHVVQPAAITIAQATERGLAYQPAEIEALGEVARRHAVHFHMDGARFANAVAALNAAPADITWRAGVDTLSFGGTKNGCFAAEAVIVFNLDLARQIEFRRKQRGHLFSKNWFVSAQFLASLTDDRWLKWAANANAQAASLAEEIETSGLGRLIWPVEANEIFVEIAETKLRALTDAGITLSEWPDTTLPVGSSLPAGAKLVRLVTSFSTSKADVEQFIQLVATIGSEGMT